MQFHFLNKGNPQLFCAKDGQRKKKKKKTTHLCEQEVKAQVFSQSPKTDGENAHVTYFYP